MESTRSIVVNVFNRHPPEFFIVERFSDQKASFMSNIIIIIIIVVNALIKAGNLKWDLFTYVTDILVGVWLLYKPKPLFLSLLLSHYKKICECDLIFIQAELFCWLMSSE